MIDQSGEKLAISMLFREHLAELRDGYRKNDGNNGNSKTTEIKSNWAQGPRGFLSMHVDYENI